MSTRKFPRARDELPSLFDERGTFVGLTEFQLDEMPDDAKAAYDQVHEAWSAVLTLEMKIETKTRALHQTVAELRAAEARAARFKPSAVDCVRAWIACQRAQR